MIFGSMRDKDISEIAAILFPLTTTLILTSPDNSRAMSANELAKFVSVDMAKESVFVTENVDEALTKAREITGGDGLICVTGSLYLVGEALKVLKNTPQT